MKFRLPVLLFLLPATLALRAEDRHQGEDHHPVTPQSILADQVKAIAGSNLSPSAKDKAIASAVRFALLAATNKVTDPDKLLAIAISFSDAAAAVAPDFSGAILDGVASVPAIADVQGALAAIQTAVTDTAKAAIAAGVGSGEGGQGKQGGNQGQGEHGGDHDFGGDDRDVVVSPSR
jgi:hypothetical protein